MLSISERVLVLICQRNACIVGVSAGEAIREVRVGLFVHIAGEVMVNAWRSGCRLFERRQEWARGSIKTVLGYHQNRP